MSEISAAEFGVENGDSGCCESGEHSEQWATSRACAASPSAAPGASSFKKRPRVRYVRCYSTSRPVVWSTVLSKLTLQALWPRLMRCHSRELFIFLLGRCQSANQLYNTPKLMSLDDCLTSDHLYWQKVHSVPLKLTLHPGWPYIRGPYKRNTLYLLAD